MELTTVKVCNMCGKNYTPTGRCQKVCAECRPAFTKESRHAAYAARYQQKGEYKWQQPKGKASHSYKDGIGIFSREAFALLGKVCMRCGSESHPCVHHKDRNRRNNDPSNWEILCKACHQKEHDAGAHLFTPEIRAKTLAARKNRADGPRDPVTGRYVKTTTKA